MAVLRAAPYSLTRGSLVKVIARAENLYLWGQYSQVNVMGALVQSVPDGIMSLSFSNDGTSTNSQVTLNWSPLTVLWNQGLTPLLAYNVYQKLSTGVTFTKVGEVIPQVTTFVATGLTGGLTYNFIIVPANVEGEAV